jgi:hypothetical protein
MRVVGFLLGAAAAVSAKLRLRKDTNYLSPREMADRLAGSKGAVDTANLPASCGKVQCADIVGTCPWELTWEEGQCCPVCKNPEWVPGLGEIPTKYVVPAYDTDPAGKCRNVKCFQLVCPEGKKKGPPVGGGCCYQCINEGTF